MWKQGRLCTLTLAWIACIHYSVDSADPPCVAGVAVLGTEYTIQGDRSNYTGFVWLRPTDGRYVVTCNPICSPVAGYRATVNGTYSTLTIDGVGVADAGTWKIVDVNVLGAIPVDVCQLRVASVDSAHALCVAGVAVSGTEYTIQGDRSNYTGFVWVRPTDGRYVVTCIPSCSPVAGYSATVNGTHSTLTIHSVGMVDAGTWKIVDATVVGAVPVDVCQLRVASVRSADSPCVGGVALLNTQYTIQTDRSSFTGFIWVRPTDGRYVVTCNPSCSPGPGYSEDTNATHSTLTIHSVGMVDAGVWKIVDATVVGAVSIPVCRLTVEKLPRCNVSGDADPTALQPNTNLTLTVDIREYYCSQEAGFYLSTGNVTEMLMTHNVTGVSDVITSSTFSVTPARLGDVIVSYTCDVNRWNLNCDGVSNLSLELPRCNVSSDADPTALQPNTNLALTVDIREYYCPQEAGFYLSAGNVTDMLMRHNVTDVSDCYHFSCTCDASIFLTSSAGI